MTEFEKIVERLDDDETMFKALNLPLPKDAIDRLFLVERVKELKAAIVKHRDVVSDLGLPEHGADRELYRVLEEK